MDTKRYLFKIILLLSISYFFIPTEADASSLTAQESTEVIRQAISNFTPELQIAMKAELGVENQKQLVNDVIQNIYKKYDEIPYYMSSYKYTYSCNQMADYCDVKLKFTYHSTKEDYEEFKLSIIELTKDKHNLSLTEKVNFVNDFLVDNAEYAFDNMTIGSPHSPVTILKEGKGVCEAYALYAYEMLNALGVDNYLLLGYVRGEIHLWNVLKNTSGETVHLDTTWNDSPSRHEYFMVNSDKIAFDHKFNPSDIIDIESLLGNDVIEPNPEPNPDPTKHPMYPYVKEFFDSIQNALFLSDLGDLPVDKSFKINFSEDVADNLDYKTKIFITDRNKNIIDIKIEIKDNYIKVYKENGNFEPKEGYYLIILKGVESKKTKDNYLKDTTYITFNIK